MAGFDNLNAVEFRAVVGEQSSAYFHAIVPRVSAQVAILNAQATKTLVGDMQRILTTFQYKGGFGSQTEAMRWLRGFPADRAYVQQLTSKALSLPEPMRSQALTRLSAPAYLARMTRKQILLENINLNQNQLFNSLLSHRDSEFGRIAQDGYTRGFYDLSRTTGMAFSFDKLPERKINTILNKAIPQKYTWYFTTDWAKNNQDIMLKGIMTGQPAKDIAKELRNATADQEYRSYRYVRTYVTSTTSAADTAAMKEAGLEQYQFYATLDDKTCELCGPLDGQIINLDNELVGENSPPIHYNCRCRKIPYVPNVDNTNKTRWARDKDGVAMHVPRNMSYAEYQRTFLKTA